ncbi:MAG: tripartite tricarboxylate transporter substrate binding protein [Betaproteobacteria bacterium]|nr:tripartite tricarboxylate transporter substrate binding protein [Betaproteobacteria bacterium]
MKKTVCDVLRLFLACALILAWGQSWAQSYPGRTIKFVVGYPPGGANDTLARLLAQKMAENLGNPVIVENRPGADGIIGTEYVAKSAPDGYTLLTGASGQMIFNPVLRDKLPYDPMRDFIPITMLYSDPLVFAVHPSVPAATLKELIDLAKARPGKLFYASAAPPFHVAIESFKKLAGVEIVNIPYKGTAQAVMATVSGEVSVVMMTAGSLIQQIRAGKLRPLAVTGDKRDPTVPDVPAMSETGLGMRALSWSGMFAPSATPPAIIEKLYSDMAVVLKSSYMKEKVAAIGYGTAVLGMAPAEFDAFYKSEFAYWSKAVKDLKLSVK